MRAGWRGSAVLAAVLAAASGAAAAGCATDATQPEAATGAPTAPTGTVIALRVADDRVQPDPGRVRVGLGDTVRLTVAVDRPDQVHVHGYDLEADVAPGNPATLEFVADQPGVFEVELHESGLLLVQLAVR